MIDVIDNFLPSTEHAFIMQYCLDAPYFYGESDNSETPVTGMVHNVWSSKLNEELHDDVKTVGSMDNKCIDTKHLFDTLTTTIEERYERCTKNHLTRLYINCFSPNDNPYFHTDVGENQDGITFLYYPNFEYNIDNGGETQFEVNGALYGIQPFPNRLVCFPANILHRATSHRNYYRFTVAIKYEFD
tara:strand:- start:242 stop:802 length:561 start_codon:yes stop_codon:yes gene_type:complete